MDRPRVLRVLVAVFLILLSPLPARAEAPAQATQAAATPSTQLGGAAGSDVPDAGPSPNPVDDAGPTASEILDVAIVTVKANALRADQVDWSATERELRQMAEAAHAPADVYPAIRLLLTRLGDQHSFALSPSQVVTYDEIAEQNAPADLRVLSGGVGYIGVPRYVGMAERATRAYSQRVHEGFATARKAATCGWVVDLRANEGGNMWPMLSGLKPLLGQGDVGTFLDREGKRSPWAAGSGGILKPPPALYDLYSAWVAVLTGPRTASAGEFVTIAFRGRPNTRSFGRPTRGLSTGNFIFPLPDGGRLVLTTVVGVDRMGQIYGDRIVPDEVMWGNPPAYPGAPNDWELAAAERWLRQASGCGMRATPGGRRQPLRLE